jgi:hypothetical protein
MTFELEAEGVRVRCSSTKWARELVNRGARLVDPRQADALYGEDGRSGPAGVGRRRGRQRERVARKRPAAR